MYSKSILENGLCVVTDSMPDVRSIAMGIMVGSGSRDESAGQNGLAHLTEHLMFQGTSSRNALQIARLMDEAGGQTGAFTSRDYTCFTTTVLDDYCTYALDLMGDILLNSIFPPLELERQKSAIIREIAGACDQPAGRADTLLKSHVWGDHALGQPPVGRSEAVDALTRDDVIYFVHSQYVADRMVVAAAGNVEHEDFTAQVRDAFWRLTGGSGPRATGQPGFHSGAVVEHMGVSQVYFAMGIRVFPYTHPDRYAVHVINRLLGGGISSRLFRRIRESQGLVYHIDSEYQAYRDDGLLVIEGSTTPEHVQRVLRLTLTEIRRMFSGEDPVDQDELWKAKKQLKTEHLIAAENTNTRMGRLATQALYFDQHISTDEIIEQIDAVDLDALRRIMEGPFITALGKAAIAAVGPEDKAVYGAAWMGELLAGIG